MASALPGARDGSHDVIVVGSGLVGASLACALGDAGLRVGLIEAAPPGALREASYDDRPIAVSLGSRRIFEALGLWEPLAAHTTPIHEVHVSDRGHFGFTRLTARACRVEALGYVTTARVLGEQLSTALHARPSVERLCPARVLDVRTGTQRVDVDVGLTDAPAGARELSAALLVAADGGRSELRAAAGVSAREKDYRQTAITANVTPVQSHANTAYERFTSSGPLALLPMSEARCGLVWTVRARDAEPLMALGDAPFLDALAAHFGRRLGGFSRIGQRSSYPLALIRAGALVRDRLVIVGNAAHQLHPVAGQGFNLGLRDAACLAETVVDAVRQGHDHGAREPLDRYAAWRRPDQSAITLFTDTVVGLFSNAFTPAVVSRNLGLLALDLLPVLKRALASRAMGLAGRQPRLARGLPL